MALIRGVNGHCPCPVCLVEKDKQGKLCSSPNLRTAAATKAIFEEKLKSSLKEKLLKKFGLRNVQVKVLILSKYCEL